LAQVEEVVEERKNHHRLLIREAVVEVPQCHKAHILPKV